MVCIGTSKELYKARELPDAVRADIAATVHILDSCYGADRDMIADLGGFVGIVGDFQKLLSDWHIDVRSDVCESCTVIEGYVKKLFILNPDYAVVLYIKEELLQFLLSPYLRQSCVHLLTDCTNTLSQKLWKHLSVTLQ